MDACRWSYTIKYINLITMLFSAESTHGILKAEAGIVDRQMVKSLNIIVQVFTSQRNTSTLPMWKQFSPAQSEFFVAMSRISLQGGKGKGYVYHTHARPMFR
jgi:hypothetical protein